jgi:transcriptional regulator of acetoin/glycerol metabolism
MTVTFEVDTRHGDVEHQMMIRTLAAANNNRKKAAELVGVSRRAIYHKLRKHNVD